MTPPRPQNYSQEPKAQAKKFPDRSLPELVVVTEHKSPVKVIDLLCLAARSLLYPPTSFDSAQSKEVHDLRDTPKPGKIVQWRNYTANSSILPNKH